MPFNPRKEVTKLDIASMSMALGQNSVMVQASISVAKKAMDASETQMQGLLEMMPQAPSFGHSLDIRA